MNNYQVEIYAVFNGVKKVFYNYSKENMHFEDLKISILKRLGNIHYFERDKQLVKQLIYNAKTIDEMLDEISIKTRFIITVKYY
ncbi:hypothetical protein FOE41_14605 [Listeria monocytogenes]|nr:hypothetical protein [Listeria monocytogenes]ECH5295670.1 hypothetical protein [Listeria monocytogenes]